MMFTLKLLMLLPGKVFIDAAYDEWIVPVNLYDSDGPSQPELVRTWLSEWFLRSSTTSPYPILDKKNHPPRYAIGLIDVGSSSTELSSAQNEGTTTAAPHHFFTWDLGNPGSAILLANTCQGCPKKNESQGCPVEVPLCPTETNSFCYSSHPRQFLPPDKFELLTEEKQCWDARNVHVGDLDDAMVCMACFGGGDHSRYFSPAVMNLTLVGATNTTFSPSSESIIPEFRFGALVRTVPLVDRVWSNIGIGYHSRFLQQLPAHTIMLDLDYYGVKSESRIIFNPEPDRYVRSFDRSPYKYASRQRHLSIKGIQFGENGNFTNTSDQHHEVPWSHHFPYDFFTDTGNEDISVADSHLRYFLEKATGGSWKRSFDPDTKTYSEDKRLIVPWTRNEAPDVTIVLERDVQVNIPGYAWIYESEGEWEQSPTTQEKLSRTVFSTYGKNVLGLPFLSAPGYSFVFDDENKNFYSKKVAGDNFGNKINSSTL